MTKRGGKEWASKGRICMAREENGGKETGREEKDGRQMRDEDKE